ncbi:superoxide dismutase [Aminobacter ciceronei]|uniref:Superoxide dismutase n=1 Tax=Aminobacter ciceronei TaxID=150723 RepID=A0ABR6C9R7_9HYPH|nr:superoxide dismutase [Aminobacter ciceronei]MBA8907994.1 Fe-Mn family superoxide dismutase [Aminobacter ciceronei]MBA9021749.1 Fe-Mn family superoxide dismutase [Aminobacter ciceronei]
MTAVFELPDLPYEYGALEPFMSRETLKLHHGKHHLAYVENGRKLAAEAGMENLSLKQIVKRSFGTNSSLFNNAAQHYNHTLFWKWMKRGGGNAKVPDVLQKAIDSELGGYENFRTEFIAAGMSQFGSGWAWLALKDGALTIMKTPNAENPTVHGGFPILGVDVWEHSYYVDYRNARQKYLEAFFDHLINWEAVLQLYEKAAGRT